MINKKYPFLIILLIICTSIFLICSKGSDNATILDEVKLKDTNTNKGIFAIMLEKTDDSNEYEESNDFPTAGYLYNGERSGCIDGNNKAVENVLTYNEETKKVSVSTKQTVYCYLYFKKDSEVPTVGEVTLKGTKDDNASSLIDNYTHTTTVKVSTSWNDEDVTSYCISTNSDKNSCNDWKATAEKNLTEEEFTLSDTEGTQTVYIYLKDKAGNISESNNNTITLDKVDPTVSSLNQNGESLTEIVLDVTASDGSTYEGKGISLTCSSDTNKNCSCLSTSQCTLSGLNAGTSYNITVTATDNSGRTGTNTQSFKTKELSKASEVLKGKVGHGSLQSSNKGDLKYRYVGTKTAVTDNYICFGTTTKNDCTSANSNYLYRIIGVDNSDRLKLIKDTALSTSRRWHSGSGYSGNENNAVWDTGGSKIPAELYTDLNSTSFLNNNTYVPTEGNWKEKIDETNWKIGDSNGDKATTGDAIWTWEQKETASTASKIGLMYLSDYYYSYDGTGTKNCRQSSYYPTCKTSWLHLTNNDLSQNNTEWTMSRYGLDGGDYVAWYVATSGSVYWNTLGDTYAVRPVFYLKSDVKISGGEGTLNSPYILSGN